VNLPKSCIFALICALTTSLVAQQTTPSAAVPVATEKARVFITDSESWEVSGSAAGSHGSFAAQSHGGARPQTAEIIKTFGQRCSEVLVNNKQEMADYIVLLDHEGGKGYLRHRNKVAVFERVSGDVVVSHSTLSLGGSVEEACNGITQHWAAHSSEILSAKENILAPKPVLPAPVLTSTLQPSAPQATVTIGSTPPDADIEIDGAFVGSTPSTINVAAGSHDVAVKKKGFIDWTKKLNVTGGSIHLNAELEQKFPTIKVN
jgi:hypothetical protein